MEIRELRKVFDRLRRMYAAAGAKGPANDLSKVAKVLEGHEHRSVETFVTETKSRLAALEPPATDTDQGAVVSYTRRLLAADTNQPEFDIVFRELKMDKEVTKSTLDAIANRYRNDPTSGTYVFKFKTRNSALQAIRDTFIERAEGESKRGIIEKITRFS